MNIAKGRAARAPHIPQVPWNRQYLSGEQSGGLSHQGIVTRRVEFVRGTRVGNGPLFVAFNQASHQAHYRFGIGYGMKINISKKKRVTLRNNKKSKRTEWRIQNESGVQLSLNLSL